MPVVFWARPCQTGVAGSEMNGFIRPRTCPCRHVSTSSRLRKKPWPQVSKPALRWNPACLDERRSLTSGICFVVLTRLCASSAKKIRQNESRKDACFSRPPSLALYIRSQGYVNHACTPTDVGAQFVSAVILKSRLARERCAFLRKQRECRRNQFYLKQLVDITSTAWGPDCRHRG